MKRKDLNPSTITIKELFSYDKPYIIPGYQRPYEWNRKQIENMLNTIIEAFESKKQDALLFGTIQFNVVEKNGEQTEKEIIDGHQRITTFYLLLKCLDQKPEIQYYNQIVGINSIDELIEKNHLYKENYDYICECVKEYKNNDDFNCFIKDNIVFVSIEISNCYSIDDTLQVFNSLNTTGLQLQVKDIFKIHYCDYLSKHTCEGKSEILVKINQAYNNLMVEDELYSLEEDTLLDIFRFYIMSKSDKSTWASDFRMSNNQYFNNLFSKNEKNEVATLEKFVELSECLKNTQIYLKDIRDLLNDDLITGVAKELLDWCGYGKIKNIYYYLIFIQYEKEHIVTKKMISFAEQITTIIWKYCSVYRFTHSKIINEVFNNIGKLIFSVNELTIKDFKNNYIDTMRTFKKEYPNNFKKFEELFEVNNDVINCNKPHLILAVSYINDAQNLNNETNEHLTIRRIKEDLFYRDKWDIDIEHILSYSLYDKCGYVNSIGNLMYLDSKINKRLGVHTKKIINYNGSKLKDFDNKLSHYKDDNLLSVKMFCTKYNSIDFIERRNDSKLKYLKELYFYDEIMQ